MHYLGAMVSRSALVRLQKPWSIGLWAAVALAVLGAGCVPYYRIETLTHRLAVADVIVVPGFELTEQGEATPLLFNRMAMARVLLEGGYGERVLVSGGKPKQGVTEADRMVELGVQLGIDRDRLIVEPQAESSIQNAEFSAEILARHGFRSALVVTDAAHLSYCVPVFRDAYVSHGLELYWTPVDYELLRRLGLARDVRGPVQ